ncbi:MAG: acetyl ornithine aminotransferase family protein [Theionarchaea archaeon]|nr:MAG: 4-aminobutyrate aminotransferase [Theionarchaea archaeon DG-70]MBU7011012.1 acetyl ornithine aminotransferase family protein [Theionarchaea archaeon]
MEKPQIRTELPGPKAKEVLQRDEKYISSSYTRGYPLVAKAGRGMLIEDMDGNTFYDFAAGIAVCATGHSHPKVAEAIKNQADKLIHMSGTDFYYMEQVDLAQKLAEITPGNFDKRVFYGNSGAEAIECGIKLARWYTKRVKMFAFLGAFHGRTMGALSLTASKALQKERFAPFVPGVIHVPYAYCYRCAFGQEYGECTFECIQYIEHVMEKLVPPTDVAAIFAEPIQGEGGYIVPPPEYFGKLKKLCEEHNILLVDDEVQAGFGRTGKMFAIEHWDVVPDIICMAKGIASGMPLGACVASSEIMSWPPGAHASTFGGNPVSCAASLATIELLQGGLIENAAKVGAYILGRLQEMKEKYPLVGDVRGKGLMVACELVKDRKTKEPAKKEVEAVIWDAWRKGVLLLPCGKNAIRFVPPLIVTEEQAAFALDVFEKVIKNQ